MKVSERYSAGGKATAIKLKNESLEKYYNDPKVCKNCGNVIVVKENEKVSSVRKKIFCDRSCSTQYHNRIKPKREKKIKETKPKPENQNDNLYAELTKQELKSQHNGSYFNWRSSISKNARKIFNNSGICKKCIVCGYQNHVDVAHIIPVYEFHDLAKISEINGISNLVALCPNHHWELDNGFITREEIQEIKKTSRGA